MPKQSLEQLKNSTFDFFYYYTQNTPIPEKKKLKQKLSILLKKSGWSKKELYNKLLNLNEK